MKGLVVVLFIFVVFTIVFVAKKNVDAASLENQEKDAEEAYTGLRSQALGTSLKALAGVSPVGSHGVYGVLMETGYPKGVVTLATFLPGDASLYFSNGGGMIGGGGYDQVRKAVINFNKKADKYISKCQKTSLFPLPVEGQTIFYILTKEGIYTYQAKEEDLGNERNSLSPLFFIGHNVITQFRLAAESKEKSGK